MPGEDGQPPELKSTPGPQALRTELHGLAQHHLLGPEAGPKEELPSAAQVSEYYLLGMLAPRGETLAAEEAEPLAAQGDPDSGQADDEEKSGTPHLFPSSIGLTFAADAGQERIEITASWGRYARVTPDADDDQKPKRVWRRHPMSGALSVVLAEGSIGPLVPVVEQADVVVEGRCRRSGDDWLVTLFLVNGQEWPKQNRDEAWLFQAELSVAALDDSAVFVRPTLDASAVDDAEALELEMLYRHQLEFAVGHGTAVHATPEPDCPDRATKLTSVAMPMYEVPRTEAPTGTEIPGLDEVGLDMRELAETEPDLLAAKLQPLVDAYRQWISGRRAGIADPAARLDGFEGAATAALDRCERAADRIAAGIELLIADADAARAFRFANEAMWLQRVHTMAASARREAPDRKLAEVLSEVDVVGNRSWRPFQLAFVLLNLPSLTDPTHAERSEDEGLVDLLWFPTGGGKTEAYLGLVAYTLAIRRLQGEVGGLDGDDGVAVVMRYTLRLLTAQQFQRAAALLCACEQIRSDAIAADDNPWGDVPFRIGLWVGGKVTPGKGTGAAAALDAAAAGTGGGKYGNPVQLASCPWCGTPIDPAKHAHYDSGRLRTLVWCGDKYGRCPFTRKQSPDEGLPVVTVDDEIYRLLPGLVIATVDKFAQLPWQGQVTSLFGRLAQRCERHGWRNPDLDQSIDERDEHRAKAPLPSAKTVPGGPLRPPDLIVQDELHLISGPLGSLTGLYETAIDELCTWEVDGQRVRPKVIASTATARRAREQAKGLFWRDLEVFPPPGTDIADSFFARQRPVDDDNPGRLYLGICAQGRRLKAVEIRVYVALLAAAQTLYEKYGQEADPWMTLVGYFNSMRELGGMRRLVDDDVATRLSNIDRRGLDKRRLRDVRELTSRIDSSEIPQILERLGVPFDPNRRKDAAWPIDVVLATSMISVGVDVPRLGLMVVAGQPKTTAEYIQASSRVGRTAEGPGLIVTVYNWARPRDLSHYETFEHYHATFYRHVEATTLTPFSARCLDRGLTGVMTSLVRHRADGQWNANEAARTVDVDDPEVDRVVRLIARRAAGVTGQPDRVTALEDAMKQRLQAWSVRQNLVAAKLGYKQRADGQTVGLLKDPGAGAWELWTAPNSLREVESPINLLLEEREGDAFVAPEYSWGAGDSDGNGSRESKSPPTDLRSLDLDLDDFEAPV